MPLCIECQTQHDGKHVCKTCLRNLREVARCRKGAYYQIYPWVDRDYHNHKGLWNQLATELNLSFPVEGYIRKPVKRRNIVRGYQLWHKIEHTLSWGASPPAEIPVVRKHQLNDGEGNEAFRRLMNDFCEVSGIGYYYRREGLVTHWLKRVVVGWPTPHNDTWWTSMVKDLDPPQHDFKNYVFTFEGGDGALQDAHRLELHEIDRRLVHFREAEQIRQTMQGIIQSRVVNVV